MEVTPLNPYSGEQNHRRHASALDPLSVLRRVAVIAISSYGLRQLNFYNVILRSPHIRHEWFKVGLAGTIGKQPSRPFDTCRLLFSNVSIVRYSVLLKTCSVPY